MVSSRKTYPVGAGVSSHPELLSDPEIQRADWIGFIDRNPIQQGKSIDGRTIYSYEAIPSMGVDVVLVAPPEKHRIDILDAIARNAPVGIQIAELGLEAHPPDRVSNRSKKERGSNRLCGNMPGNDRRYTMDDVTGIGGVETAHYPDNPLGCPI